MSICHKRKIIFIHIPKTAGTSIMDALGGVNYFLRCNPPIQEYKKYYQNYWKEYTKFTVVRDPIDRFISAYKFARADESYWYSATGRDGLKKHPHYDLCKNIDINEYVIFLNQSTTNFDYHLLPQTFFICNEYKSISEIDYYVRYENIDEDLRKIGISEIKKLNTTKIKNKNLILLTNQSKKLLSEIYSIDYKNIPFYKPPTSFDYF